MVVRDHNYAKQTPYHTIILQFLLMIDNWLVELQTIVFVITVRTPPWILHDHVVHHKYLECYAGACSWLLFGTVYRRIAQMVTKQLD